MLVWETMTSSVTNAGSPQQSGKKGKDKNKDVIVLMEDRLAEFNTIMSTLTGRIEDMDKRIEEFESDGDMEELRGEIQAV